MCVVCYKKLTNKRGINMSEKQDFIDSLDFALDVVDAASTEAIVMNFKRWKEMENYKRLVKNHPNHDDEQHVKLIIEDSGRVSCVQYNETNEEERTL